MHERYGITADQLINYGKDITIRNTIRNYPYWHFITVVTNQFQWDAVVAYMVHRSGIEGLKIHDGYGTSAAYHMWHYHGDCIYSLIGVHRAGLPTYSPNHTRDFINGMAHEIQHAIIAIENHLGINSVNEEEPRAYATGNLVAKVIKILSDEWKIGIMAVPREHYSVIRALQSMQPGMMPTVSTLAALSGIKNAHMAQTSSLVQYGDEHEWSATTYYNGGERE